MQGIRDYINSYFGVICLANAAVSVLHVVYVGLNEGRWL